MLSIVSRTTSLILLAAAVLAGAQDRIAGPVDLTHTALLRGNLHPRAQARFDQGPVDAAMPISYATLHLQPAPGLEEFLASQQDPKSPNYHHWLTPEEFGDRFGLSTTDLAKITGWLRAEDFQIHDVARGRHWITFSGTAAQVAHAFHTQIHRYLVNGQPHFSNATEPSVPAALGSVVAGIRGLHDFRLESQAKIVPLNPQFNAGGGRALSPGDLAIIFDMQRLYAAGIDGTGQTIAIMGQSRLVPSDTQTFRAQFNLPPNNPSVMLFGKDPGVTGDLVEADLDVQWAGAVAPNASIIYVYSTDVFTSSQYAIDQNVAPVMSLSYGGCEAYSPLWVRAVAQQANVQGITWLVASGDSGAVTCDGGNATPQATLGPTVSFPANFPEITAVGGTEFTDTSSAFWATRNDINSASAKSYIPEKAWNDFSASSGILRFATGGGASALVGKPAWQTGPGVPNADARHLPDVSLPASATVPYLFIFNGQLFGAGGTSASSPSFAGVTALLNQHLGGSGLGNINPALYRLAQATQDVFNNITQGDNKAPCQQSSPGCVNGLVGFNAGTGFNMTTGWGSVDAYNLVMEWNSGTATVTTLQVTPASGLNLTDTVQLSASVQGAGNPPTGTVTFLTNDIAVASAPLVASGNGASATATVAAVLIASGNGTVSALYSGDTVYQGSEGAARITLNAPAGAALVVPSIDANPVYEQPAFAQWPYTLGLVEKGGVATSITAFTVNGVNNLSNLGSNPRLAANGKLSAVLGAGALVVPIDRVFAFSGTDANGNKWTSQITASFLPPIGTQIAPGISITSPTTTIQQNPQADPSCAWSQQVSVQELGGYTTLLSTFSAGSTSLSSQIPTVFGTTRLAPFGVLNGTVCFSGATPPTAKTISVSGISSLNTTVAGTLSTSFTAASTAPVAMSTGISTVSLAASPGGSDSANVPLNFAGGSPQWTVTVSPANRTSSWLTVTPTLATGTSPVKLQASAANLSPGAYNAIVSIQAVDAMPQVINIPVTFVVGGSTSTIVGGVSNAFSGGISVAPGMTVSVYGVQLANTTAKAKNLPLPLSIGGVTATVNGFSAPLYFVSPGQINLQVPYEAGVGQALLAIDNNGQITAFPFTVASTAPGLLADAYDNAIGAPVTTVQAGGPTVLLLFVTGEGDVTPTLATGATPSATITDPTKLPHARQALTLTVGGVTVTPLFAGIPNGLAGTTQIDFQVPAGVPAGKQPVVVTVGGVASPPIFLNVTAAAQ